MAADVEADKQADDSEVDDFERVRSNNLNDQEYRKPDHDSQYQKVDGWGTQLNDKKKRNVKVYIRQLLLNELQDEPADLGASQVQNADLGASQEQNAELGALQEKMEALEALLEEVKGPEETNESSEPADFQPPVIEIEIKESNNPRITVEEEVTIDFEEKLSKNDSLQTGTDSEEEDDDMKEIAHDAKYYRRRHRFRRRRRRVRSTRRRRSWWG